MTIEQTIEQQLSELGYTLQATLTQDDFNGRDGQNHWKVTILHRTGSYTCDYHQGCAHRHYGSGAKTRPFKPTVGRMTIDQERENMRSRPNVPTLTDVLYCLVSDANSIEYSVGFEDWASELGYDTDSIKAKAMFDQCVETFLYFRHNMETLTELFQDY